MVNEINTNSQAISTTVIKNDAPAVRVDSHKDSRKIENVQPVKKEQGITPGGNSVPVASLDTTPSNAEVQEFVHQMQDHVQSIARDLKFSIDEESGRTVVTVIDSETNEVVRQIPSEEILNLVHAMKEEGSLLVEAEA